MKLVVIVIATLLAACVHNPYLFDHSIDQDGVQQNHLLKYGNYCGDGHPVMSRRWSTDQRKAYLLAGPVPVDDLDAACYAHDMCFEETETDYAVCDWTLRTITLDAQIGFDGQETQQCWNLMAPITGAFLAKVWSKGDNWYETLGYRTLGVLAVPVMAVSAAPYWVTQWSGFPEVGSCNFAGEQNYRGVVSSFEAAFSESVFGTNARFKTIVIQVPDSWPAGAGLSNPNT